MQKRWVSHDVAHIRFLNNASHLDFGKSSMHKGIFASVYETSAIFMALSVKTEASVLQL